MFRKASHMIRTSAKMTASIAVFISSVPGPLLAQVRLGEEQPLAILLAAGDIASCKRDSRRRYLIDKRTGKYVNQRDRLTADVIRQEIARASESGVPIKVIALGDLAYQTGRKDEFEKCFDNTWGEFKAHLLPVPGNHEYDSPDAAPYFAHFKDNPFVHQHKGQHYNKGYFSLNFPNPDGPWRLVGLNDNFQYGDRYKDEMQEQLNWLQDTLARGNEKCVLAFWHEPLFSSGKHGHEYRDAKNTPLTKRRPMQNAFKILYSHGVSIVLTGHDHNYEQFSKHDADGRPMPDGIRSFVVGTGGAGLTTDHYVDRAPNSEGGPYGRLRGNQGVLKIKLYNTRFTWDFLPVNGQGRFSPSPKSDDCTSRKESVQ